MLEGAFQVLGFVGLADEERMQADRHDTPVARPFFVKYVELVDDHVAEVGRTHADVHEYGKFVELDRVGHGEETAPLDVERERLIVGRVVAQILDTKLKSLVAVSATKPSPMAEAVSISVEISC